MADTDPFSTLPNDDDNDNDEQPPHKSSSSPTTLKAEPSSSSQGIPPQASASASTTHLPASEQLDEELDATIENEVDMLNPNPEPIVPESMDTTTTGVGGGRGVGTEGPGATSIVDPNSNPLDLEPSAETRLPTRKDISLRDFLGKMDDYAPIVRFYSLVSIPPPHYLISTLSPPHPHSLTHRNTNLPASPNQIPDAITAHHLTLAGLPPPNPSNPTDPTSTPLHLSRLLALATQKFVADIAADAYQYSRMRSGTTTSNNPMGTLGAASGLVGAALPSTGPAAAGAGAGGAAGAGGGGGGGGGGAGEKGTKGGTGQHVLGIQRAGFGGGGQGGGQGRTVLTMEDLGMAVGEYGVNIRRGEFYR
ncbi:WD repeat-containing protein 26 [Bachmanniomyces sp. S44760]|nr:WD repeat-containing protein 26 [Bachmanniomyces sp. S44760]